MPMRVIKTAQSGFSWRKFANDTAVKLQTPCARPFTETCRDDFVQKITGNPNVDRPLQRIREFRNRPNPKTI